MPRNERQILLLNFLGLQAEKPDVFATRSQASEAFENLNEIGKLEREYLARVVRVLSHPALEQLANRGDITFAFIKPRVFEGKNLSVDESLPEPLKDDLTADVIRSEIIREQDGSGGEIIFDLNIVLTKEDVAIFYEGLPQQIGPERYASYETFITSGPLTAILLRHYKREAKGIKRARHDAVDWWRNRIGATRPENARPGTIRNMFARDIDNNIVHGSDSKRSVVREIGVIRSVLERRLGNSIPH